MRKITTRRCGRPIRIMTNSHNEKRLPQLAAPTVISPLPSCHSEPSTALSIGFGRVRATATPASAAIASIANVFRLSGKQSWQVAPRRLGAADNWRPLRSSVLCPANAERYFAAVVGSSDLVFESIADDEFVGITTEIPAMKKRSAPPARGRINPKLRSTTQPFNVPIGMSFSSGVDSS